jgi:hypothetical protein
MGDDLNFKKVDTVLNLYYGRLPYGENYFILTSCLNFDDNELKSIFNYLLGEKLIESWGKDRKYIITPKGIIIITQYRGIEQYLKFVKQEIKS